MLCPFKEGVKTRGLDFDYCLKQEFGLNPPALVMKTCLQCLLDGRGNANRERHSILHLATGFTILNIKLMYEHKKNKIKEIPQDCLKFNGTEK